MDVHSERQQRGYPVVHEYDVGSETGTPTRLIKTLRGDRHPSLYLITKHMLLAVIFLVVIWTLLEILFAPQKDLPLYSSDMAESTVLVVKNILILGRVLVVALCVFGIFGIIRESFSLSLVFSVFMFIRLVGTLYIPYTNTGPVSTGLICLLTLMSFIHLSLVRRTESSESLPPTPNILSIEIDRNHLRV